MDPNEVLTISRAEAAQRACAAFQSVFEHGPKIELDHYVVYFARGRRLMFFFLCRTLLARSLAQAGQVQYGGTVRMPCLMRRLSALFLLTDPVYLVISIERAAPAH